MTRRRFTNNYDKIIISKMMRKIRYKIRLSYHLKYSADNKEITRHNDFEIYEATISEGKVKCMKNNKVVLYGNFFLDSNTTPIETYKKMLMNLVKEKHPDWNVQRCFIETSFRRPTYQVKYELLDMLEFVITNSIKEIVTDSIFSFGSKETYEIVKCCMMKKGIKIIDCSDEMIFYTMVSNALRLSK